MVGPVTAFTRSLRGGAKKVTGHLEQVIWFGDKKRRCTLLLLLPHPSIPTSDGPVFEELAAYLLMADWPKG